MLYRAQPLPRIAIDLAPESVIVPMTGPIQVLGKTAAGETVEARYDAGVLRVRRDATVLAEAIIGPPSHGDMLLSQIHDLVGLTIGGQAPTAARESRVSTPLAHIRPFGREHITWEQGLILGQAEARVFLEAVLAQIPGIVALETRWHRAPGEPWLASLVGSPDPLRSTSPLVLIPRAPDPLIREITSRPSLTPREIDDLAPANIRIAHRWESTHLRRDADAESERLSAIVGRTITLHDNPHTVITTRVETRDGPAKDDALALAKLTDQSFAKLIDTVDLRSGDVIAAAVPTPRWYPPSLARWAADAPDRYITAAVHDGVPLGYRPARNRPS